MPVDYPLILGHSLSDQQANVLNFLQEKSCLVGPAGSGKTTAAMAFLLALVESGMPAGQILLLVPQRTLALPYLQLLRHPAFPAGSVIEAHTLGSLSRRLLQLFWPLVAGAAGFARPDLPPIFLNLETAQYFMALLVRPLLDEGLFSSVSLDRNRLYSQVLDNLNKSALVGFPLEQLGERLKSAWLGDPGQLRVYDDVQACAGLFRAYCLGHNLVDYSLQVEIFIRYLWPLPLSRAYLQRSFRSLVFDNPEEDVPVLHDLLAEWLPQLESALLVFDRDGGLRSFLGADPVSAHRLQGFCSHTLTLDGSFVCSPAVASLEYRMSRVFAAVRNGSDPLPAKREKAGASQSSLGVDRDLPGLSTVDFHSALNLKSLRFFPELMDWAAQEVARLINDNRVPAQEIAVLAPYFSDALRFSLATRLQSLGVSTRSHRPSRSLRLEPVTGCLLTLAALVYPEWGFRPLKQDVVHSLMLSIDGLDLVRSQLLADIVYRQRTDPPELTSFEQITSEARERISYLQGQRFERLRIWLDNARQQPVELDLFFSRVFGEILSQPGYGFHRSFDAGRVTASLIDSVRRFRQAVSPALGLDSGKVGREYLHMLSEGVIAAQNLRSWQSQAENAVLLAPAYTFLMTNRPVDVQFWLDIGSRGWAERVYQPLTHPYVLNRNWQAGQVWHDADELAVQEQSLQRLVVGLARRCRREIYLGLSDLSEQGYEQRGPLLRIINKVLVER